ncbi:NnrS family protein [Marinobacteraceae bacterium S3BR75-40.1]
MPRHPSQKLPAYRVFFPAAAAHAAVAVPVSVAGASGVLAIPAGLVGPGHAHEMLFGFALALVAGYTLGPERPGRVWGLFVLWLVARLAYTLAPQSVPGMLLSPVFALVLAWWVVPRFLVAKKWRNRMISPLILVLCLLPAVWLGLSLAGRGMARADLLLVGIVLLALLMAFMGGRVLAPAVAGAFYKRGHELEARVQPTLEAGFIVALPLAALLLIFGPARPVAGGVLVLASVLIALRLVRWRLWQCTERPDLLGLGLGYAWLSLGLAALGVALIASVRAVPFLHLITVGALGSLSTGIMARLHNQRLYRRPPSTVMVALPLAMIAVATVARVSAGLYVSIFIPALWLAAVSWAVAYGVLFVFLLQRPGAQSSTPSVQQTGGVKP